MANEIEPSKVFEDLLASAATLPGVRIDREFFLRRSLAKYCDPQTIDNAVAEGPATAGISLDTIRKAAKESINYETGKVTALSAAAGVPGGLAMAGTIPADTAQYFAHVLRIAQKLAYLYSWPDFFRNGESEMDDGTKSILTLFVGVMFGVQAATEAVAKVAAMVAEQVVKKLPQKALTKGVIYPVVKKVAALIGVQMTKQTFAKGVSKVVPVIGGAISGGLTFATYKPMANKLRHYLADLPMANPDTYSHRGESVQDRYDEAGVIDVEVIDEVL